MKTLLTGLLGGALAVGGLTAQTNLCTATIDGVSCGPQLDVSFTPVGSAGNNHIHVSCSGLHQNGIGLMVWGTQPLSVPIWGNCMAYTDFVWGHQINLDQSGSWSWFRSWPNSVQATYRIQLASLGLDAGGNFSILTTDCLVAECTQ